jgi:hypothetical protein
MMQPRRNYDTIV